MSWLSVQRATDIGPESSRAEIESHLYDEDMLTNDKYKPSFQFAADAHVEDGGISCERLFIGMPGAGSHFLRCALESIKDGNKRVIARIALPEIDSEDRVVDPEINAAASTTITYLQETRTVCVDVREKVHPVRCMAWARCLSKHIRAQFVHVLDSVTTAHYFSDRHEIAIPTLRRLHTTAATKADNNLKTAQQVIGLEVPNMISGLGASIITQCQLHQVPAEIIVSIEETHALEIEPIRAYEPLWREAMGDSVKGSESEIDYRALIRKHRPRSQNSLYL